MVSVAAWPLINKEHDIMKQFVFLIENYTVFCSNEYLIIKILHDFDP